jgi:hypothetical protein
MSISDSSNKIIYAGDGHTTGFAITMPLPADSDGSDVYVYVVDNNGVVTLLNSNYSVNVGALTVTYPTVGGVAPLGVGVNALPNGWELVLNRTEPMSQNLALTNQGIWDGPSIDAAFDKLTMIAQQLQEQVSRCFKAPINVPYNPLSPLSSPTVSTLTQAIGTLAQLIAISTASPTTARFGVATDVGGGQLLYYPGYASTSGIHGTGWYAIGGGV